jgi:hypothetical protein
MRSTTPIPGNPWPHDMVITIQDDTNTLLELLWIRAAWGLRVSGTHVPPPLADASVDALPLIASPEQIGLWEAGWPSMWDACVRHAAVDFDKSIFDAVRASPTDSAERALLLRGLGGPDWRDEFGNDALPAEWKAWNITRFDQRAANRPTSLDSDPERMALDALIPAWEAGLTRLIVIPCEGSFTRRVSDNALLLTEETRDDPSRYADALAGFR